MEHIILTLENNSWISTTNSPETIELFGTGRIPTPFTGLTSAATVLAKIRALNPGAIVEVR